MITSMHHVALSTADLDQMVTFYVEKFGFEEVWNCLIPGSERIVFLRTGNAFIEMFQYFDPPSLPAQRRPVTDSGYLHFAVVVDDLAAEVVRLQSMGVEFETGPIDAGLIRYCFAADCEGNRIEFMEYVDELTPFHPTRAGRLLDSSRDDRDWRDVQRAGDQLKQILIEQAKLD